MSTLAPALRGWWPEDALQAEEQAPWPRAADSAEVDIALDAELERAEGMVSDHVGEADEPAILRTALDRASMYLRDQSRESMERFGKFPLIPYISPGPDGSVDLHWEHGGRGLLINIPADDGRATFYGDGKGMITIRGNFDPSTCYEGLIKWLSKM